MERTYRARIEFPPGWNDGDAVTLNLSYSRGISIESLVLSVPMFINEKVRLAFSDSYYSVPVNGKFEKFQYDRKTRWRRILRTLAEKLNQHVDEIRDSSQRKGEYILKSFQADNGVICSEIQFPIPKVNQLHNRRRHRGVEDID